MKKKETKFGAIRCIWQFAAKMAEQTGRSTWEMFREIIRVKQCNHMALSEYEWTGCYERSEEQQKSMSTMWSRAELRKKYTKRLYKAVLMDKDIFARVYADYYKRSYLSTRDMKKEEFDRLVRDNAKLIYKPFTKGGGTGIKVIHTETPEEKEAAYAMLGQLPAGVVEEWICQHEEMAGLYPKAVNVVRFYTVCTPAGVYLFAPVLFVARKMEISNGCQDALTAMVNIHTGEVLTHAVDQGRGVVYEEHPETKQVFKGFQIPCWDQVIEMMKQVALYTTFIANVGWDVAITPDGPILVEGNTIPGFNTAQYKEFLEVTEGYGYQPIFDEAMNGTPFEHRERYEKVLIQLK